MGRFASGAAATIALLLFFGVSWSADEKNAVPSNSIELLTSDFQIAPDGSTVATIHSELRATNDAGALATAQISVPFNSTMQELEIVEAHTLKPDGTKIPINTSTIYEQIPPQAAQLATVTDMRVKVLLFPQFAAGDTAVYTIRLKSLHPIIPNQYYGGEIFPRTVSFKEVRESFTAPKSLNLHVEAHGVEVTKRVDGENAVITLHYSAPNPKTAETVLVSPVDHEPRFFVSTFKDYAELGRAYAALSQPKIVVTPRVKALADQITGGEADKKAQAQKLYEWVARHIRYVAVELGQGALVPHDVDTILANGYGDCKDHDVLLQALLKAKDIEAESVLINSGNAYTLTAVPTFVQLNHVITRLPQFDLYLDSSAPVIPFGVLPLDEYGKPAVRVSASEAVAFTMPVLRQGELTTTTTTIERLDSNGVLAGTTATTATGPFSIGLRTAGLGVQSLGPEQAAATVLAARGLKDGTGKLTEDPPLELAPSYTIKGEFSVPGWSDVVKGSTQTVLPGGMRVLGVSGDGIMGPFYPGELKGSEPTQCYSGHAVEDISLQLPAGAKISPMPQDVRIETKNILFTAHWTLSNNTLAVHRDFTSHIEQPLCSGEVRKQTAEALKKIADSYDVEFTLGDESMSADAATQATPQQPSAEDAAYKEATDAAQKGDMTRAEQLLTDLLGPGHSLSADMAFAVHYARGWVYLRNNQVAKAIDDFSEAIRLKPDANSEMYSMRAGAYMTQQKWKLAIDDLAVALKKSPDDMNLRRMHEIASEMSGNSASVAEDLNYMMRESPNDASLVVRRAQARLAAQNYEGAVEDFEKLNNMDATHQQDLARAGASPQTILEGLCEALSRSSKPDEGAYQCARALTNNEFSGTLLESRGYSLYRLNKFADALKDFEKASFTYPQNARYLYERGATKLKLGDKAGGQRDINAAIKMMPSVKRKVPSRMSVN